MTMKTPKAVWIVQDPMDGPHIFRSKKEAWKTYKKWGREAKDKCWDSFWDMTEPTEYRRKKLIR